MNIEEIPTLAKAINRWLSYQLICGRGALLSEAYLGQPLAEFLIHRHSGEFETEVDHPILNSPGAGRPRQIDYALLRPQVGTIEVAIECKWISERPYDKQRIVNDLLRLECVKVPGIPAKRFLVVAGLKPDFKKYFLDMELNNSGKNKVPFVRSLLSLSRASPTKHIQVAGCHLKFRQFYLQFESSFNAKVPKSFNTTVLSYRSADDISVGVWQVGSSQNRSEFSPKKEWGE